MKYLLGICSEVLFFKEKAISYMKDQIADAEFALKHRVYSVDTKKTLYFHSYFIYYAYLAYSVVLDCCLIRDAVDVFS